MGVRATATETQENDTSLINVPQPAGTKSVYNASYYCEVKNVSLKEIAGDPSAIAFIVEYHVHGDMSLGPLQDPSFSAISCRGIPFSACTDASRISFADPYQIRGKLHYTIPRDIITYFASNQVSFVFGQGGYSAATLTIPDSAYADLGLSVVPPVPIRTIALPQPAGTKSVYNESYYCEVKNVRLQEMSGNESAVTLVVEYHVHGNMSLGPLQNPSFSRVFCLGNSYFADDFASKISSSDPFQIRGELHYSIPRNDMSNFSSNQVSFVFGQGGYSAATLTIPDSAFADLGLSIVPPVPVRTITLPQPAGTKSVYNESYYCEVKNVRLEEVRGNLSAITLVVEYHVHGDMSLGALQDPSSSRIHCRTTSYRADTGATKVFFADSRQIRGELYYVIPIESIGANQVTFTFGQGGYSAVTLSTPNAAIAEFVSPTR